MSKNYTQDGIGQSTEFGRDGNRVATNPAAPGGGTRIEVRENDNTTPSRTSGAQAQEPDEYITLAQFQAQSKWIAPVAALADANVASLSGATTIDGVAVAAGDRVALTAQTTATENGVWVVQAGAWTRPGDFDTGESAANRTFLVSEGATYADTTWTVSTDPPNDIIDTDNLALVQTTGQAQTSIQNVGAGTGLLAAGPQSGPGVTLSAIAAGLGIQLSGGAGAAALTVDAEVLPSTTPGDAGLVQSNAAGAATRLRDLVSADASVTIGLDGNGNVDFSANPASLPNYTSTIFVDPGGSSSNPGLNPAEPTDYATAITYANANPGTLIVLADGTYSDGDGAASGSTTIAAGSTNTGIVARNGPGSAVISDVVTINTTGVTLVGITFTNLIGGVTFGATVDAPARTVIQDCTFDPAGLTFTSRLDAEIDLINCEISALAIGGTSAPNMRMFGGEVNSFSTSFSSEQPRSFTALGVDNLGTVAFGHSGSATYTYQATGCQVLGTLSDTATSRTNVDLDSIAVCAAVNLTLNTGLSGRLIMRDVAVVNGSTRSPLAINVGDGYTGGILLHNVIFDRSTSALGTTVDLELTADDQATANQNGADFCAIKVSTTQNDTAARVLVQDPTNDNLIQWRDPATLQISLTAGQGINPTQLAADTVQTADPIEATQVPGVPLVLYRPLSNQGNGTVVIGTVPAGARIMRTTLVVESSTNTPASGANCNIGFNGGSGVELQDGSTDNSVITPDTYIADDVVRTTSAEQVEAVFSIFDGVINGDVYIEYFIGA